MDRRLTGIHLLALSDPESNFSDFHSYVRQCSPMFVKTLWFSGCVKNMTSVSMVDTDLRVFYISILPGSVADAVTTAPVQVFLWALLPKRRGSPAAPRQGTPKYSKFAESQHPRKASGAAAGNAVTVGIDEGPTRC